MTSFTPRPFGGKVRIWKRLFPERQILIRHHGRVHYFKVKSYHQLALVILVAGLSLWTMLGLARYAEERAKIAAHEEEVSQSGRELELMKKDYNRAVQRIDQFDAAFKKITCDINEIQSNLLVLSQKEMKGTASDPRVAPPPRPADCSTEGGLSPGGAPEAAGRDDAEGSLQERLNKLQHDIDKLREMHQSFLKHSSEIAAQKSARITASLARIGVDVHDLPNKSTKPNLTISRLLPLHPERQDEQQQITSYNNNSQRLDGLTNILKDLPLGVPLTKYELSSGFGVRSDPFHGEGGGGESGLHEGLDFRAPPGTPIHATGAGIVVEAGWHHQYGQHVEVEHRLGYHTRYAHLSAILVKSGDPVQRGTPIGLLGSTGRSTGPHLHYEVRLGGQALDPSRFLGVDHHVF